MKRKNIYKVKKDINTCSEMESQVTGKIIDMLKLQGQKNSSLKYFLIQQNTNKIYNKIDIYKEGNSKRLSLEF